MSNTDQNPPEAAAPAIAPKPPKKPRGTGRHDMRRDQEVMKRLEDALVAGNTYKVACVLSGISERSFMRWKAEGLKAKRGSLGWQFLQLIKGAEAKAIHRNVMVIQTASKKNWTAAAWWLERRCPDDFGRRDTIHQKISAPDGGPVKVEDTSKRPMTEEERKDFLKRAYERSCNITHDGAGKPGDAGKPDGNGATGPSTTPAAESDSAGASGSPAA